MAEAPRLLDSGIIPMKSLTHLVTVGTHAVPGTTKVELEQETLKRVGMRIVAAYTQLKLGVNEKALTEAVLSIRPKTASNLN